MKAEENAFPSREAFKRVLCDEKGRRGSVPVVNKLVAVTRAGIAMSSLLETAPDHLELKIGEVSSAVISSKSEETKTMGNSSPDNRGSAAQSK